MNNNNIEFISPPITQDQPVKIKLESNEADGGTFGKGSDVFEITSLSRNDAPPAVKTDLVINGKGFGTDKTKVKCEMVGSEENYELNVWKIEDTKITVVLLGGKIGQYTIRLYKEGYGYAEVPTAGND